MNDFDDLDLLEQVMSANAPGWTSAQRLHMTELASRYLARSVTRAELVRDVRSVSGSDGAASSWSVFATWLVRRAGKLGVECRDTRP